MVQSAVEKILFQGAIDLLKCHTWCSEASSWELLFRFHRLLCTSGGLNASHNLTGASLVGP